MRKCLKWLQALAKSEIPTTLIWGELDAIAPAAVPDYVWDHYLQNRESPAGYWRIPCADHYLQVDVPDLMANIMRTIIAEDEIPAKIQGNLCQALRIK